MTGHNDDALLTVKTREKAVCFNTKILSSRKIDFSLKRKNKAVHAYKFMYREFVYIYIYAIKFMKQF